MNKLMSDLNLALNEAREQNIEIQEAQKKLEGIKQKFEDTQQKIEHIFHEGCGMTGKAILWAGLVVTVPTGRIHNSFGPPTDIEFNTPFKLDLIALMSQNHDDYQNDDDEDEVPF